MKKQLHLTIISQDSVLLDTTVDSITAPASEGQVTILPDHLPLFTSLVTGELVFRGDGKATSVVVSKGFLDVGSDNSVSVIVDTATHERDISLQKAEMAVKAAQSVVQTSKSREELLLAEASLRSALLEVKIAQKAKSRTN